MEPFRLQINQILTHALLVIVGIIFWTFIALLIVLSIPIYIYRWLITKVVAPFFRPDIGNAVSAIGQLTASEFTQVRNVSSIPSRVAIVVKHVVAGQVSLERITQLIESRWIQASLERGELKYPEFQQYIESWMGFMFFKKEQNFQLKDHIYLHKLNENGSEEDAEIFLGNLTEELVNKPFPLKKSPWEAHLIQNYRNSELDNGAGQLSTVLVLRIHHGMGDGFAVMHVLVEALLGQSFDKIGIANPKPPKSTTRPKNICQKISKFIKFLNRFLHESGYAIMMSLRKKTSWHIPDEKKSWKQIYGRSPLIPIEKLKFIKNRLDVTLSSVLIACTTGASAEMMKKSMKSPPSKMAYGFPVPVVRNRGQLRNEQAVVVLDVPCSPNMDIVSRLKECECEIQRAKQSSTPMISRILMKLFACNFAVLSRFLFLNRYVCTTITNFPGPGIQMEFDGMKVLAMDFVAGALEGEAGVTFMVLSYKDSIRICSLAENAVLTRKEMNEMIENVCALIDKLYLIANNVSGNMKIDNLNEQLIKE